MKPHPTDLRALPLPPDQRSRTDLVREEGPVVLGLCRRLDPDPEDAFQEIWEKVFRNLHRFDPDGPASFRTWLVRVAHRHLIDRHRRRQRRGEHTDLTEAPAQPPTVEDRLSSHQRTRQLETLLQKLPDDARRVVVMHHIEGVPLTQIAATEGVALGTVKSRLHRIRARLLAWFTEEAP
ncbi:MAG: sigma-70 family RNA polymerase sigma factor [Myxococcota bacterium]